MRFKTFWAERTVWRDGRKLHPHVPPSGINVQSTNRGVSTIKSKRVFSWDQSTANLHIVFLIGAFFATGRNWTKIEIFKFQLHPFASRYSDDPIAPGIIWVRDRVIRGEDCSRKPTDYINLVTLIWQTTYSKCFLCKEWKQRNYFNIEQCDDQYCALPYLNSQLANQKPTLLSWLISYDSKSLTWYPTITLNFGLNLGAVNT